MNLANLNVVKNQVDFKSNGGQRMTDTEYAMNRQLVDNAKKSC